MRVCFRSQVDPQFLDEYRRRHADVWPQMLHALRTAGWENYTLHLGDDGLLIGIVECNDLDDIRARMALTEVNARWQAEMATLFPASESTPDNGFMVMEEVFNLDQQLAAAGPTSEGQRK